MFTKYPRLEKHGNNEVERLLDGEVFIFPKIAYKRLDRLAKIKIKELKLELF